jgi:hypothetical protein
MSARLRWAAVGAAILLLGLLLWLSLRGARGGSHARAAAALPSGSATPDRERPPEPRAAPARGAMSLGPFAPPEGTHASPAGGDDLQPHPGAMPPKDPDGPVRDWRDFTDDERAAVSGMELDVADMGDVIERLEGGAEVADLRGAPVTADEQASLRAEVDGFAASYEDAYDRAYGNQTTVIEMSATMHTARTRFDQRVREIYGLTDAQFYALFPYRRELGSP